jgi:hypothetical protein
VARKKQSRKSLTHQRWADQPCSTTKKSSSSLNTVIPCKRSLIVFGAHRDTIYKNYFDKYTEGRAAFKKAVRLAQFKRGVLEGSDKMLIHIGKSNLDEQKPVQRDEAGRA